MGFDESYIITMSSSLGKGKDEDCTLMIWDEGDLRIPDKHKLKKNHTAVKRNCVHPKLILDPDQSSSLYINSIAEYYGG